MRTVDTQYAALGLGGGLRLDRLHRSMGGYKGGRPCKVLPMDIILQSATRLSQYLRVLIAVDPPAKSLTFGGLSGKNTFIFQTVKA